MFQEEVVGKFKTHISYSVTFFFESLALYGVMWKNIVEPERLQMTTWRTRISCWVPRLQIHTIGICNTNCLSTATLVTRTHLKVVIHTLPALEYYIHSLQMWVQAEGLTPIVQRSILWNLFEKAWP